MQFSLLWNSLEGVGRVPGKSVSLVMIPLPIQNCLPFVHHHVLLTMTNTGLISDRLRMGGTNSNEVLPVNTTNIGFVCKQLWPCEAALHLIYL